MAQSQLDEARKIIEKSIESSLVEWGFPDLGHLVSVDIPTEKGHGDLSSSVAMKVARHTKIPPIQLANRLKASLNLDEVMENIEAVTPGFLNFTLKTSWLVNGLNKIRAMGLEYGRHSIGRGQRVLIEFVSANPTGPLLVVNGRAAAVGDSLCRILGACGYEVDREFYVNDAGNQIKSLGRAIALRIDEIKNERPIEPWPEGVYPGQYIIPLAQQYLADHADAQIDLDSDALWAELGHYGAMRFRIEHEHVLKAFGVRFDRWFSEKSLRDAKLPEKIVAALSSRGLVEEREGAKWFVSEQFGDDKDRVMVKSDGTYTYFVPDAAYHADKFDRGYDWVIDLLGPDHHGYIGRMKALVRALGYDGDHLEIMIIQVVRILRSGEVVRMSKRGGQFVTLDELIEETDVDPARYFFLERAPETPMDFDLDLARLKTNDNPVFYIQYAAARIQSVLRQWQDLSPQAVNVDLSVLIESSERELMLVLLKYPETVLRAANDRAPQYLTRYLMEVASAFHSFYRRHRILEAPPEVRIARIALSESVLIVIRNGLDLLGISVPESM